MRFTSFSCLCFSANNIIYSYTDQDLSMGIDLSINVTMELQPDLEHILTTVRADYFIPDGDGMCVCYNLASKQDLTQNYMVVELHICGCTL